jgi:hypothetical protein
VHNIDLEVWREGTSNVPKYPLEAVKAFLRFSYVVDNLHET